MIPQELAHHFGAHQVADGRWRARCPSHDGKSSNSLSINAATDGKTLIRCWGGCPTDEVLNSAGLAWADLFPPSSSSEMISDPEIALRRKAEKVLLEWREKATRIIGYRLWLRHRLIAKAERLIDEGRSELGWDLMELGYLGLSRLTWLADLLVSKHPQDWFKARRILKGTPSL